MLSHYRKIIQIGFHPLILEAGIYACYFRHIAIERKQYFLVFHRNLNYTDFFLNRRCEIIFRWEIIHWDVPNNPHIAACVQVLVCTAEIYVCAVGSSIYWTFPT